MIVSNIARCKKCGDTITSKSRHDFVPCSCGAIAVDGGHEYLRRTGNPDDMDELSTVYDNIGDYLSSLFSTDFDYYIELPKNSYLDEIILSFNEQCPDSKLGVGL